MLRNPASSFTAKWSHLLRFRDGTKKMDSDIRDTVQLFKALERPIGQTGRYEWENPKEDNAKPSLLHGVGNNHTNSHQAQFVRLWFPILSDSIPYAPLPNFERFQAANISDIVQIIKICRINVYSTYNQDF